MRVTFGAMCVLGAVAVGTTAGAATFDGEFDRIGKVGGVEQIYTLGDDLFLAALRLKQVDSTDVLGDDLGGGSYGTTFDFFAARVTFGKLENVFVGDSSAYQGAPMQFAPVSGTLRFIDTVYIDPKGKPKEDKDLAKIIRNPESALWLLFRTAGGDGTLDDPGAFSLRSPKTGKVTELDLPKKPGDFLTDPPFQALPMPSGPAPEPLPASTPVAETLVPVPVPAGALLLVSALGLAGAARRFARR